MFEHAGKAIFIASYSAVDIFFVLSGFYMSHIITANKYPSLRNFYYSRALRIFPTYYICLFVVVVVSALMWAITSKEAPLMEMARYITNTENSWMSLWVIFSNLFIVTSDFSWFVKATDFNNHPIHLLVLPPVWSLSIELYFYLLAPFLIKKSNTYLINIILSILLLKMFFLLLGFNSEEIELRFVLFQMIYFLIGVLSYRLYLYKEGFVARFCMGRVGFFYALFYIALAIFFYKLVNLFPLPNLYGRKDMLHTYLMLILLIPAVISLFHHFKKTKVDTFLADIAFPIYLLHYGFIGMYKSFKIPDFDFFCCVVISTIVVSLFVIKLATPLIEGRRIKLSTQNFI